MSWLYHLYATILSAQNSILFDILYKKKVFACLGVESFLYNIVFALRFVYKSFNLQNVFFYTYENMKTRTKIVCTEFPHKRRPIAEIFKADILNILPSRSSLREDRACFLFIFENLASFLGTLCVFNIIFKIVCK